MQITNPQIIAAEEVDRLIDSVKSNQPEHLSIYYVALSKLEDYYLDGNSKLHDLDELIKSFYRKEGGFLDPVKIDSALNGGQGGIIEGNGRVEALAAAKETKKKPPKGIINKDGEWYVPTIFGNDFKSEKKAIAYSVDHNVSNGWGIFDFETTSQMFEEQALFEQMKEIGRDEFEENFISFDISDYETLREKLGIEDDEDQWDDDVEEGEIKHPIKDMDEIDVRTKIGDVWQLGESYLCCGDALDENNVKMLLAIAKVTPNFVWADPPYGIKIQTQQEGVDDRGRVGASKVFPKIAGDDSIDVACAAFPIYMKLFPKAFQVWWGANHYSEVLPSSTCWIAWDKDNGEIKFADGELAFTNGNGAVRFFKHKWHGQKDSEQDQERVHPTQKPIALFNWTVKKFYKGKWTVTKLLKDQSEIICLDPFLGSGISILGAYNLSNGVEIDEEKIQIPCRTIGFELSPEYATISIDRWEAMTGETAKLIDNLLD